MIDHGTALRGCSALGGRSSGSRSPPSTARPSVRAGCRPGEREREGGRTKGGAAVSPCNCDGAAGELAGARRMRARLQREGSFGSGKLAAPPIPAGAGGAPASGLAWLRAPSASRGPQHSAPWRGRKEGRKTVCGPRGVRRQSWTAPNARGGRACGLEEGARAEAARGWCKDSCVGRRCSGRGVSGAKRTTRPPRAWTHTVLTEAATVVVLAWKKRWSQLRVTVEWHRGTCWSATRRPDFASRTCTGRSVRLPLEKWSSVTALAASGACDAHRRFRARCTGGWQQQLSLLLDSLKIYNTN